MQIVNLVAVVANNQSTVNQSVGKSTQCLAKILKKMQFWEAALFALKTKV